MSSVKSFREFVNERLTAAAEEIFGVFKQTVMKYEEEIDHQRKLLDIVCKPEIRDIICKPGLRLQRIELPEQDDCQKEEVPADQQLCDQERNSSLSEEEPEPLQIKEEEEEEEEEEVGISQEEEQNVLKSETDAFIFTPTHEESDHRDPELKIDHQIFFNSPHEAESQDQDGCNQGGMRNEEPIPPHHSNNAYNYLLIESPNTALPLAFEKFSKCDMCGKSFKFKSQLNVHMITHTGEKPYCCDTCGQRFTHGSSLSSHKRIHTGERPYSCKICGRSFRQSSGLKQHMITHTNRKSSRSFSCNVCGKRFDQSIDLRKHKNTHKEKVHLRDKPYTCNTCGKHFSCLTMIHHIKRHGVMKFTCEFCGQKFRGRGPLNVHLRRAHTDEKPYPCKMCGKSYFFLSHLTRHQKSHTAKELRP